MKKTCTGCKNEKLFDEFGKDKKGKFGLNQKCKACCNERAKHIVHSQSAIENKKKYKSEWQKAKRPILNARLRVRYIENLEESREQSKQRQKKYMSTDKAKAKHYERNRAYEKQNPEKISAQRKVRRAIRNGKLIRPEICEICNMTGNIAAHHEDYQKPLKVIWMCGKCHIYQHQSQKFHRERLSERDALTGVYDSLTTANK